MDNNNDNNNNSSLFAKPCCSPAAEVSFLNGFFSMLRGEICSPMVSQRQGTGVMSKLSVYECEETKTWPKP